MEEKPKHPAYYDALTGVKTDAKRHSHYHKHTNGLKWVDVYWVLLAWRVYCPATAHAVKKLLNAGQRGAKDKRQDLQEAIDSIQRAIELLDKTDKKETTMLNRDDVIAVLCDGGSLGHKPEAEWAAMLHDALHQTLLDEPKAMRALFNLALNSGALRETALDLAEHLVDDINRDAPYSRPEYDWDAKRKEMKEYGDE